MAKQKNKAITLPLTQVDARRLIDRLEDGTLSLRESRELVMLLETLYPEKVHTKKIRWPIMQFALGILVIAVLVLILLSL